MKKNGYLRKFIAMFLVFVMLMADSSMTTFADVVGRSVQQNAVEDEENGIDLQSANDVNVTVTAPDGTYYLAVVVQHDSWTEAKSKVAQVNVSGGNAQVAIELNYGADLNNAQVVLLTLKNGKNYQQEFNGDVYQVNCNNSYVNNSTGSYKITSSSIVNNTATLSINSVGSKTTSQANILGTLGMASNFMIVSNKFVQSDHYEGNIAVNEFVPSGSPIGVNGTETTLNLTITVSKTVTPAKSAAFNFGIYDANNKLLTTLTVTTGKDGKGSNSYTINDAQNSYRVYELDDKGKALADGDKNGEYTVKYSASEGLDNEIPNYGKSSFVKIVTGKKDL